MSDRFHCPKRVGYETGSWIRLLSLETWTGVRAAEQADERDDDFVTTAAFSTHPYDLDRALAYR